jgi:hypothetical protein
VCGSALGVDRRTEVAAMFRRTWAVIGRRATHPDPVPEDGDDGADCVS